VRRTRRAACQRDSGGSGGEDSGAGNHETVVLMPEGTVAAEVSKFALHDGDEMLWV
jgi:hypothetical protein